MSKISTNPNKWFKRRRTEDIRRHIPCNGIILKATSQSKDPESERNFKKGLKLTQHKRQTLLYESAPKKLKASSEEDSEVVLATNISKGMMRKKVTATKRQENAPHGTIATPTDRKTTTQLTLEASASLPSTQQQRSSVQQQREPLQQLSAYRQWEQPSLSLIQHPPLASALTQQPSTVPLIQHERYLSSDCGQYVGNCINCIEEGVDCVEQHPPFNHCSHLYCNSSNPAPITNEAEDLTTDCCQHGSSNNIVKSIQSVASTSADSIGLPDSSLEEFVPSSQLSPATILRILNCDTDEFINDL